MTHPLGFRPCDAEKARRLDVLVASVRHAARGELTRRERGIGARA